MEMNRRQFVGTGVGAAAAITLLPSVATAQDVDAAINAFTGGADTSSDGITLIAPEIAENGNTVPIEVDAPGAEAIILLAAIIAYMALMPRHGGRVWQRILKAR